MFRVTYKKRESEPFNYDDYLDSLGYEYGRIVEFDPLDNVRVYKDRADFVCNNYLYIDKFLVVDIAAI